MKSDQIKNIYEPVPLEHIQIQGKIGSLMDKFFHERVLSDFARSVIYQETEDAFRRQTDDTGVVGMWQGEFWGKWIISAVRVCRYCGEEELKDFIRDCNYHLMSLQRADGYIGTYRDSGNVFPADPEKSKAVMGWPCSWNWNIWCRKYTLWGMLESYELLGDGKILDSARRLADQLLGELKEKQIDITKTGTFAGMPSCSIMKPMLVLYRNTGDETYLEFCKEIADKWETHEKPGLIANSLERRVIDDWYEDTVSWSKTYECLSCFDGLLELYRITGKEQYLEAAENFYELLETGEKNLLFSVGYNDQFYGAASEINAITEPCDVIHYIRLCFELFRLTGRVRYMDSIELIYYNAFLASPCKDGTWAARTVRGAGKQEYSHMQAGMRYSHCCVNNLPRGFLNAAECAVMTGEKELLINMYHAYEAQLSFGGRTVKVCVAGDYMADSSAVVQVVFDGEPADVCVRIPGWSKSSRVTVNGEAYSVQPGYFKIPFRARQMEIRVEFDNTAYVKPFGKPVPRHSSEDWQYRRWGTGTPEAYERALGRTFLDETRCTIQKGAVLLCRSKLIGNTAEEMFGGRNLIDGGYQCRLEKCQTEAEVMVLYTAHISDGQKEFCTPVCDYASAGNMEQEDEEYFSIYF